MRSRTSARRIAAKQDAPAFPTSHIRKATGRRSGRMRRMRSAKTAAARPGHPEHTRVPFGKRLALEKIPPGHMAPELRHDPARRFGRLLLGEVDDCRRGDDRAERDGRTTQPVASGQPSSDKPPGRAADEREDEALVDRHRGERRREEALNGKRERQREREGNQPGDGTDARGGRQRQDECLKPASDVRMTKKRNERQSEKHAGNKRPDISTTDMTESSSSSHARSAYPIQNFIPCKIPGESWRARVKSSRGDIPGRFPRGATGRRTGRKSSQRPRG